MGLVRRGVGESFRFPVAHTLFLLVLTNALSVWTTRNLLRSPFAPLQPSVSAPVPVCPRRAPSVIGSLRSMQKPDWNRATRVHVRCSTVSSSHASTQDQDPLLLSDGPDATVGGAWRSALSALRPQRQQLRTRPSVSPVPCPPPPLPTPGTRPPAPCCSRRATTPRWTWRSATAR
jgi:hypothetical protein